MRHKINPFNTKAVMLDHQCCIENAHLRRLVCVFDARCKYQNIMKLHVRIQVQTPLEKSQNIGFSSNTCPDPLKIAAAKPAFNVGHSLALMAFRWRADDGPLKVGLGSSLSLSTLKTNVVKVGSPLTKPSGSAHESCPSTIKFQSSRFTLTACMRGSRTFVRGGSERRPKCH